MERRCTIKRAALTAALLVISVIAGAQNTGEKEKTPEEIAWEEAEKLEDELALEPHQTFYVDSVLQHDLRGMYEDLKTLKMSGTSEYNAFNKVKELWSARIDSAFRKILDDEQWKKYNRRYRKKKIK